MAQSQHQPGPAPLIRHSLRESSSAYLDWLAVDRKLAPSSSGRQNGDIAAVLNAWRLAERSLALHLEAGPEREEIKAEVTGLRAEYQRLFKAAISMPRGKAKRSV